MTYTTLISVPELKALGTSGRPFMLFDCSFDLMKPASGAGLYREA
ncbi:MAG: sulfurtransferase, partial [Rubrivivax sp.]